MFVFFEHPATPVIYPLSLHDALPISGGGQRRRHVGRQRRSLEGEPHLERQPAPLEAFSGREAAGRRLAAGESELGSIRGDRKSTRLNSSHVAISYAVFCLKKKKNR